MMCKPKHMRDIYAFECCDKILRVSDHDCQKNSYDTDHTEANHTHDP